jgi:hypothetical protein
MSINTSANISFTYPALDNKWQMTIASNGLLIYSNNKQYPYLFWEGEMENLNYARTDEKIEGSIVTKENVTSFLEEKLTQLGLNATEQTDFITFWSPLIMQNEKSYIQLLVDDAYDVVSTMDITPAPDNIRRVYILFSDAKEIDASFIDSEKNYKSFDRSGFTIVEWGGTEIKNIKKL